MGVSVDNKPSNSPYGTGYNFTFRQQIDHWLKEFEDTLKNTNYVLTEEQKELLIDQASIARELLSLMREVSNRASRLDICLFF